MTAPFLDQRFAGLWKNGDLFQQAFALDGEVFRHVKSRQTIRFAVDGHYFFIKKHYGAGWREIFKNLLMGKLPVLGAANEFLAIRKLESLGIPSMTVCAFAERGENPATRKSFIVTEEMTGITLEDFCKNWKETPPSSLLKHSLICHLADICGKMHFAGLNHRDCYLCHFLLDQKLLEDEGKIKLSVMDLHRAEIRLKIPERLREKDLAGIIFSALDTGCTETDFLRFAAMYGRHGILPHGIWDRVWHKALKLYRKEFGRDWDPNGQKG